MFHVSNDGMHDFGYPCTMPHTISVDGLFVDDSNVPDDYTGLFLFADPDDVRRVDGIEVTEPRPFPYAMTERITIRNLETASGRGYQVSANERVRAGVVVNG